MSWPRIPYEDWADTCQTLLLWTQIIGKIRMKQASPINHWWHVTLYVSSRGLTTSLMPHGDRGFEIELDFIDHRLSIDATDGRRESFPLEPMSVADFYAKLMRTLANLELEVDIYRMPQELPDPIPFDEDQTHRSYDADAAHRFWLALVQMVRVFETFRGRFIGKSSPVQFFWGSFDLALTRFSGRPAPPHPGIPGVADIITTEGYSHEVSSAGFWPGGNGTEAAFYAYAYPEPEGYARTEVRPAEAFYSSDMKEFLLPYEAVRTAESPDQTLLEFLESTYAAAAERGNWDRHALEKS